MAFDLEHENERHAASWRGFVVFATVSSVAVAIMLMIMAAVLL